MQSNTIFISAATIDLEPWRNHLHKAFSRAGFRVLTQDQSLGSSTSTVSRLLEEAIQESDCVIHLAGLGYGSHAQLPFPDFPSFQCSWTQFEYYFAHKVDKDVIAFVCAPQLSLPGFEETGTPEERAAKAASQESHRQRVSSGRFTDTPVESIVHRVSNERVDSAAQLVESVASAVGTLHKLDQSKRDEAARCLKETMESLLRLEVEVAETKSKVTRIQQAVETIATRKSNLVIRLLGWCLTALVVALLLLTCFDVFTNSGELDTLQYACVAVALLSGILLARRASWLWRLTLITACFTSLLMGCFEPLMQKKPFYVIERPRSLSWRWHLLTHEAGGRRVQLLVTQNQLQNWVFNQLAEFSNAQIRTLPIIQAGDGGEYVLLPIQGKLEGSFKDGVNSWRSILLLFTAPHLQIDYDANSKGFDGSLAYNDFDDLVEVSHPTRPGVIPWEAVKIETGKLEELHYAAVLNEALELICLGEKDAGLGLLFSAIHHDQSDKEGTMMSVGVLERIRLMALQLSASKLLLMGSVGRLHRIPLLSPLHDALSEYFTSHNGSPKNTLLRWAVQVLQEEYKWFGAIEKANEIKSWASSCQISNQMWSPIEDKEFDNRMKRLFTGIGGDAEEVLGEMQNTGSAKPKSYFDVKMEQLRKRSFSELSAMVNSSELNRTDRVLLARHLMQRSVASTLDQAFGGNRGPTKLESKQLLDKLLEYHPKLLPERGVTLANDMRILGAELGSGDGPSLLDAFEKVSFVTPMLRRLMPEIEQHQNEENWEPIFLPDDFDFQSPWWSDIFMNSFANLLVVSDLPQRRVAQMSPQKLSAFAPVAALLGNLARTGETPEAQDFFSRDGAGKGELHLAWLVYWECIARAQSMDAVALDRICRDVTKQSLGTERIMTARQARMFGNFRMWYSPAEEMQARQSLKFEYEPPLPLPMVNFEKRIRDVDVQIIKNAIHDETKRAELQALVIKEMKTELQNHGYWEAPDSSVEIIPRDDEKMILHIKQGPLGAIYALGKVEVRGNAAIPTERLLKPEFLKVEVCTLGHIELLGRHIHELYEKAGFLDMKSTRVTYRLPGDKSAHMVFQIEEGKQYRIQGFSFDGQFPWGQKQLMELTTLKAGGIADLYEMKRWKNEAERLYRENGYPGTMVYIEKGAESDGAVDILVFVAVPR